MISFASIAHQMPVAFREMGGIEPGRLYVIDDTTGLPLAPGAAPTRGVILLAGRGEWSAFMARNLADAYRPEGLP